MRHILLFITLLGIVAVAGCGNSSDAGQQLRDAELALAEGDMTAARSVADKMLGPSSLQGLSAIQLARLSMVYMHMAEEENDNTALVATAGDLYRRACRANADSAEAYYSSLSAADEMLAAQLSHIVAATDSAGVLPVDEPVYTDSLK